MTATAHLPRSRDITRRDGTLLRYAAVLYLVAWGVHNADHLRRGTDVVTTEVMVLGTVAGIGQLVAIALVLRRHRLAPLVALLVGLQSAVGITAVHLLPEWSAFSDAFPGARGTGVNGLSWLAVSLEVASAVLFAAAAGQVMRERARPS